MKFKIFKTITVDKKPSTEGINISSYAQDMLTKIKWNKKQKIDLVRVTVKELGFDNWTTTEKLFARAKEMGLELCPPQVGLQLRVEYKDQPMDEWLYIGMEPISDRYGTPSVFRLDRVGGGLWLNRDWAYPDSRWYPEDELMFSLSKSSLKLKPLKSLTDTSDPLTLKHLDKKLDKISGILEKHFS